MIHTFVTHVKDCDSFFIQGSDLEIRIANLDTPESWEPNYNETTNKLRELIEGRKIKLEFKEVPDTYGRTEAKVHVGGKSVRKLMKNFLIQKA